MCTIVYSLNYFNHLINLLSVNASFTVVICLLDMYILPEGLFFLNIRIVNDSTAKFLFSYLGNKDVNSILLKYNITPKPPPRHLNNNVFYSQNAENQHSKQI